MWYIRLKQSRRTSLSPCLSGASPRPLFSSRWRWRPQARARQDHATSQPQNDTALRSGYCAWSVAFRPARSLWDADVDVNLDASISVNCLASYFHRRPTSSSGNRASGVLPAPARARRGASPASELGIYTRTATVASAAMSTPQASVMCYDGLGASLVAGAYTNTYVSMLSPSKTGIYAHRCAWFL